MLLLLTSLKLVAEIALLSLVGQGVLAVLCGEGRRRNFFYLILSAVSRPFVVVMRHLTPRIVMDRHLPLATFLCLMLVWALVAVAKVVHCLDAGLDVCR